MQKKEIYTFIANIQLHPETTEDVDDQRHR